MFTFQENSNFKNLSFGAHNSATTRVTKKNLRDCFLKRERSKEPKADSMGGLWVKVVLEDHMNAPCGFSETGLVWEIS